MKPLEPGSVVEGYRIERPLGRGGSGTTYEATCGSTGERVALKRLAVAHASDWKQVDLFEREARVLEALDHPGIPRYLAHFTVEGPDGPALYIAEELVVGRSLADLVGQSGVGMSEQEARALAEQLLLILDYLGRRTPPVIHRDIKPENVIRRADGTISLVDFGAARVDAPRLGGGSTTIGTYGYMAPEQLHGVAAPATDIYGLACTLLFLLTGRPPSDLPRNKLRVDFRGRVPLSPGFARWLERALEPAPEDRFSSATSALLALRSPGADDADPPRRPSPPPVVWVLLAALGVMGGCLFLALHRKPETVVVAPPGLPSPAVASATAEPPPVEPHRAGRPGYPGRRMPEPRPLAPGERVDERMIVGRADERGFWPAGLGPPGAAHLPPDPPARKPRKCTPKPRYTIVEDGTDVRDHASGRVRDNTTRLLWLQIALKGSVWRHAGGVCEDMAPGFRLPTQAEVDAIAGSNGDDCAWPLGWTTWTTTPNVYTGSTGGHVPDPAGGVTLLCVK